MKDRTILLIVAIVCITILEITALTVARIDGAILSSIVAAITFIATGKYYKYRYEQREQG